MIKKTVTRIGDKVRKEVKWFKELDAGKKAIFLTTTIGPFVVAGLYYKIGYSKGDSDRNKWLIDLCNNNNEFKQSFVKAVVEDYNKTMINWIEENK